MHSIITIHHIHNFGSVFQAYALQRFLEKNGCDSELIDYRPAYYEAGKSPLKTMVGRLLNLRSYHLRARRFEAFLKNNDKLSPRTFRTEEELADYYRGKDGVYIAGGDQLWNDYHPCGRDDAYKLTFADCGRKLTYGTSMGRDSFTDESLDTLAAKTKDFSRIMLRESVNVPMLGAHTAVPVDHVIDPVGLLSPEDFRAIAKPPKIKEPYAVMYLADKSELLDEAVAILSKKLGLKIVHICGFRKKCACDVFEKAAGPEEILGYIANAEFVLSASFHATMFSLIFNRPFATLLPGAKTNARIEDILGKVGLSSRILRTKQDLSALTTPIDFTEATKTLDAFRAASASLLLDTLGKGKNEQ